MGSSHYEGGQMSEEKPARTPPPVVFKQGSPRNTVDISTAGPEVHLPALRDNSRGEHHSMSGYLNPNNLQNFQSAHK